MKRPVFLLALPLAVGAVVLTVPLGPAQAGCSPPDGTPGDDTIACSEGKGGATKDTVYADGVKNAALDGSGNDTVIIGTGDVVYGDSQSGDGYGNDTITASGNDNTIYADTQSGDGHGADTVTANGDNNTIYGDSQSGTAPTGDDDITFGGNDNIVYADSGKSKSGGDDLVTYTSEGGTNNYANGGPGFDTLHFDFEINDSTWSGLSADKGNSFGLTWLNFETLTRKIAELVAQADALGGPDCGPNPYKGERPFNKWCDPHTGDPNETLCHGLTVAQCAELGLITP